MKIKNRIDMEFLWTCIPVGKDKAVSYEWLCQVLSCDRRTVRAILHELSLYDNGDDLVLIRSSQGAGFYRTDDKDEIARYRQEVKNRGRRVFQALKKIDRVIGEDDVQISVENNLRARRVAAGLSQADIVRALRSAGFRISKAEVSKWENGVYLPTPAACAEIAKQVGCNTADLISYGLFSQEGGAA